MANIALIRGAAMAAPKFTDIRGAVEPGIQTFKNIQALRQKEIEKREKNDEKEALLDARAYELLPALVTDGIPEAWQSYYNEQGVNLKNEAYQLSKDRRNIEPLAFVDAQRKLTSKINKMQEAVNWIKTYAAEEKMDHDEGFEKSNAYTEDEREMHLAILNMDVTPTEVDGEMALQYTNSDGQTITKRLSDIERLQRKEYAKDNEIQKDLDSFLFQARKSGKFPGDPEFDNLLNTKLNSIEMNKHQARSLAIDVFGIGGSKGLDAINIPALRSAGIKIENFDQNKDGKIQQDEYEKMLSSIQSINDLKNIVKEQYRQVAINQGDKYKESWEAEQDELKKAQAAKNAGFDSKWEYDIYKANLEKQNLATVLNPLKQMIGEGLLTDEKINMLVNNEIPGLQIYQNTAQDEDGNLLAPDMFAIEVNGKQIPFNRKEDSAEKIFKNILDLYGYSAGERYNLFDTYKKTEDKDEFSEYKEEPTRYQIEQKAIEEITSGRYDKNKALQEKLAQEEEKQLSDTLLKNFKAGRISSEYLTGKGKPIYDNWLKTGGKNGGIIDLSLRSN